jgi:hypothetical protein
MWIGARRRRTLRIVNHRQAHRVAAQILAGWRMVDRRTSDPGPALTATNHSRTRDEAPAWAFFLFVSKGFSGAIRLSATVRWPEIGLRTPRVSFHPPFTQIETHSKMFVFSCACRKQVATQLKRARPISMRTETPEGGVVLRKCANSCEKSLMTNSRSFRNFGE